MTENQTQDQLVWAVVGETLVLACFEGWLDALNRICVPLVVGGRGSRKKKDITGSDHPSLTPAASLSTSAPRSALALPAYWNFY